jgi:FAD/FMN-containing dehydrogenase
MMQTSQTSPDQNDALHQGLVEILGAKSIRRSYADRTFYSSDVYSSGVAAECVITPQTLEALQRAVGLCTGLGHAVVARGGGLSYSAGYLPVRAGSVIVDLSGLNRIVEINSTDMFVTVECGCTWYALYEALAALGLRTPYFGPMSGYASTVGGALSQGSVFLGSTLYGTSAESALSLDVVLADGSLLSTGSASGTVNPSPFFRTYGPDLTGLFLGDCGSLGIKARATLQLVPFPAHSRFLSFSYGSVEPWLQALTAISRSGLAAECFGTDPYVQSRRIHEQNISKDLTYLKAVASSSSSLVSGLGAAARMAWKGRRSLGGESYILHITLDEASPEAADAHAALLRNIAGEHGTQVESTVPRSIRSLPFTYPNDTLGDRGERWVPTHGLTPHSRASTVIHAVEAYFAAQEGVLRQHGIEWGYLAFAISTRTTLIEPLFYWPDQRTAYHERMIQPQHLARLPSLPANPDATAAVELLRNGLITLFADHGCAHLQIGKTYPYLQHLEKVPLNLLQSLKNAVDPLRQMNPGSLGLD